MKKALLTLALLCFIASLCACQPKDDTIGSVAVVTKLEKGDENFLATSLGFKLNVASIESYVYQVEEGENPVTPDPAIMFASTNKKDTIADGEHTVYIYGVEGAKTYTVHFAFRIAGTDKYIAHSIVTSTHAYTRLINVMTADRFEIKIQFNAADSQYFKYVICDRTNYNADGESDIAKLNKGVLKKGSQIITHKDNEPTEFKNPHNGQTLNAVVKPGASFVVLMAYCDQNGKINFVINDTTQQAPARISPIKPNEKSYSDTCSDKGYSFVDKYAKVTLVSSKPLVGVGEFAIDKQIKELSAKFLISPPVSVTKYTATIMSRFDYNKQIAALTEDGINEWIHRTGTKMEGPQMISNSERLKKDSTYKLIIIGECDQTGETQIQSISDFVPLVSRKEEVVLEIVDITPAGTAANKIVYNVKAPSRDCDSILYMISPVDKIESLLALGMTYDDIILKWGKVPQSSNWADLINSESGLDITLDDLEQTDNRFIIASFNIEERIKVYTKDCSPTGQ